MSTDSEQDRQVAAVCAQVSVARYNTGKSIIK
jgi:hypothetical protein